MAWLDLAMTMVDEAVARRATLPAATLALRASTSNREDGDLVVMALALVRPDFLETFRWALSLLRDEICGPTEETGDVDLEALFAMRARRGDHRNTGVH